MGNPLAGDDGFGPAVLRRLAGEELPPEVELADGGVLGIDLLSELEEIDRLILVDAVRLPGATAAAGVGERGLEAVAGRPATWLAGRILSRVRWWCFG